MKLLIYSLNNNSSLWLPKSIIERKLARTYHVFTDSCILYEISKRRLLLVNALSGAVDYVEGVSAYELGVMLRKSTVDKQLYSMTDHFRKRGYLYINSKEEKQVRKNILHHHDRQNKNIELFITLTTICNFACTYCYQRGAIKTLRTLSRKDISTSLNGLRHFIQAAGLPPGAVHVVLYGGEPLLAQTRPLVTSIFKTAAREGWLTSIITNGYTLFDYAKLLKTYRKNIAYVVTTLDGPEPIHNSRRMLLNQHSHGTFKEIVKGIDHIANLGIKIAINMPLDPTNVDEQKKIHHIVRKHAWRRMKNVELRLSQVVDPFDKGTPTFSAKTKSRTLRKDHMLEGRVEIHGGPGFISILNALIGINTSQTIAAPLTFACKNLKRYILHVDGKIYPCLELSCIEKKSIGRWKPRWRLSQQALKTFEHTSPLHIGKCKNCSMVAFCGGPCPAKYHLQNYQSKNNWCPGADGIVAEVINYLNRNKESLLKRLSRLRTPSVSLDPYKHRASPRGRAS